MLIAPQKLEVILAALAPRLGIEVPPVAAAAATERAARKPYEVSPEGIAIIPVEGTLVHKTRGLDALSGLRSYVDIQQEIEDAATDPAIKGILLEIDSPGGEVAGAFDVADTVYSARAMKPLFAVANNDAFSAAYLLASGAQRIYVSRTSGVGSVGVIVSHLDMSVSDEKMGYRYTIVSAGARKADFNPHAPLSDEAKGILEGEIARTYGLLV
ncbi:MAG TPA: S49 family peptidase, partial [Vicinamibacterales bacterium]